MIGSCDICDRQNVPVSYFSPEQSAAGCDTSACYLCQGEEDADPFSELDEEPVAQAINSILTVLDCFMQKANSPETVKEIEAEAIGIGQILSRAQLILGFLEARKQTGLRIVRNG